MPPQKPREIAFRVLNRWARRGRNVEELLEAALAAAPLPARDRALCQELVYGVIRWQAPLDWLVSRQTAKPPSNRALQMLLRLGLYQLVWLERVPDHAAVNETVQLARQFRLGAQAGFVNATLRHFARQRAATRQLLAELKTTQPALGYSHPDWLWQRWQAQLGPEPAIRLLEWNNQPPPTYARVNTLKTDPGQLLARWREEDVAYDFCRRDWFEENLVFALKSHPPLARLRSFQQGWFYVQDPSTLLAVQALQAQPGETVLDLCAAPGGKTTFLAQRMQNQGRIVAVDAATDRLKRLVENCARLGVSCVTATDQPYPTGWGPAGDRPQAFDRILVDVPCTNTGVLRRRVDLRWRLQPQDIARLCVVQMDLLRQAARHVKSKGVLVYSTCSLEPEENRGVVEQFLAEHPGFVVDYTRQLCPWTEGVDGAYVVRLRKK